MNKDDDHPNDWQLIQVIYSHNNEGDSKEMLIITLVMVSLQIKTNYVYIFDQPNK